MKLEFKYTHSKRTGSMGIDFKDAEKMSEGTWEGLKNRNSKGHTND